MYEEPNSLCRLCMSEEIHDGMPREENCYQWISDYLSIQINPNDQISQVICAICHLKLTEFHEFRIRSLEVQEVLQALSKQSANQSTIEDVQEPIEKPSNQSLIEEVQEVLQTKSEEPWNQSSMEEVQEVHKAEYEKPENPSNQSTRAQVQKVLQAKSEKQANQRSKVSQPALTLECDKCSKVFKTKKRLWSHMKFHKEQLCADQFQCEICHKTFGTRTKFKDHGRYHRSLEKHMCTQCGKPFDRIGRLRRHMNICTHRTENQLALLEAEYTWELSKGF
nr:zinc finger and SCAN domain-containing protein 31 [Aedes albopictus]XP_029724078.1 zinc finger and SCAN domain-containing protein 31 [Aedes albopictus]